MSNYNYLLQVGGERYFAQVSASTTDSGALGASREGRMAMTHKAHQLGVGPAIVSAGKSGDFHYTITQFGGPSLAVHSGKLPLEAITKVGQSLATLHRSSGIEGPYSWAAHPTRGARRFCNEITPLRPEIAHWIALTEDVSSRVDELRGDYVLSPVHVDLVPENILWDGERILLIDWEYSGMGDPLYDLADFCAKNQLTELEAMHLLSGWGEQFSVVRSLLLAYMPLPILREVVWACRALELDWRSDVDYYGYAASRVREAEVILDASGWPF